MSDEQAQKSPPPEAAQTDSGADAKADAAPQKKDPIRRVTLIVLIVCAVLFVWHLLSDRITPHTDQARVTGLVVPIVPQVAGYLTEVNVRLHSVVNADDVLFQIDPRPYEIAVQSAEANLDNTAQQVGAMTATVKSAAARLGIARAQLDRSQRTYDRTQDILSKNPGALSQVDKDRAPLTVIDLSDEQSVKAGRTIGLVPAWLQEYEKERKGDSNA